jgi:hypothetical protein
MPGDPHRAPGIAALPIKNFAQFYSDESKDPCNRRYDRIMQRFDASHREAPGSAALYEQVVNLDGNVPQA